MLTNTIVSGNKSSNSPDILTSPGFFTPTGVNFIGDLTGTGRSASATLLTTAQNGSILLAPLGQYGGPAPTHALLPDSPARNAAAVLTPAITADQRGFPIIGPPDIGAYEAGTLANFAAWAQETVGSALSFGSDTDDDGAIAGLEYALRRHPAVSDISLSPDLTTGLLGERVFAFRWETAARDLRYIVQRNADLSNAAGWTEIYRFDTSTGAVTEHPAVTGDEHVAPRIITITDPAPGPRQFWRRHIERVP